MKIALLTIFLLALNENVRLEYPVIKGSTDFPYLGPKFNMLNLEI